MEDEDVASQEGAVRPPSTARAAKEAAASPPSAATAKAEPTSRGEWGNDVDNLGRQTPDAASQETVASLSSIAAAPSAEPTSRGERGEADMDDVGEQLPGTGLHEAAAPPPSTASAAKAGTTSTGERGESDLDYFGERPLEEVAAPSPSAAIAAQVSQEVAAPASGTATATNAEPSNAGDWDEKAGELRHKAQALHGTVTPPPNRGVADWRRGDTPAGWTFVDSPDVKARLEALGAPALADLVLQLRRENAELREALGAASQGAPSPPAGRPAPDSVAGPAPLLPGVGRKSPAASSPTPPLPGLAPRRTQEPHPLPQLPSTLPRPQQPALGAAAGGALGGGEPPQPQLLQRRISRVAANVQLANQIREELVAAVGEGARATARVPALRDSSGGPGQKIVHSNFFLPDLSNRDPKLREFLLEKLLAASFQRHLEQNGALNWATLGGQLRPEHRLDALWTQSDGNCLLHALLLAMGALHDTQTVGSKGLSSLRAAMSGLLDGPLEQSLEGRWRAQLARDHAAAPHGVAPAARLPRTDGGGALFHFEMTTEQLQREWAEMKAIAGRQGAFLDSVHVFALAQVLRRPVVMLAQATMKDQWGVPVTPVHFRGVYLPLECDPAECCREPLVLCFQDAHFMPLVPTEYAGRRDPVRIPLADSRGEDLPLRFALPEELASPWQSVMRYMDVEELRLFATGPPVHAALLRRRELHPLVRDMLKEFLSCGEDAFEEMEAASRRAGCTNAGAHAGAPPPADGCRLEDRADVDRGVRPARASSRPPQVRADRALDAALAASLAAEEDANASLAANAALAASSQPGLFGLRPPPLAPPPAEEEPDADFEQVFNVKLPQGSRPGDALTWNEFSFRVPDGYYGQDTMPLRVRQPLRGETIREFRNVTRASRQEAVRMLTQSQGSLDRALNSFYSFT